MFLVDRSGSMRREVGRCAESIGEVIHGNRSFRYGVRFFPPTDGPAEKGLRPPFAAGCAQQLLRVVQPLHDWYPEGNALTTMLDRIVQHLATS